MAPPLRVGDEPVPLLRTLRAQPGVSDVNLSGGRSRPPGQLGDPPGAPGAAHAHALGWRGRGVRFASLEDGFGPHPLLPPVRWLGGVPGGPHAGHGTASLSVVCGRAGGDFPGGFAPEVEVGFVSAWGPGREYGVEQAIVEALLARDDRGEPWLRRGDVLLLEVQRPFRDEVAPEVVLAHLPVETEPAVFEAVRLAVALGLIVVAAAGNSSADLDMLAPWGDSGAILVSAAWPEVHPGPSHVRLPRACHGRRIDAYGWGAGVIGLVPPDGTAVLGGTSAAAAMIAGVACLLSEAHALRTAPAHVVPSLFVRDLLRAGSGVPSRATAFATRLETDRIGRLPDLRALLPARRLSEG